MPSNMTKEMGKAMKREDEVALAQILSRESSRRIASSITRERCQLPARDVERQSKPCDTASSDGQKYGKQDLQKKPER